LFAEPVLFAGIEVAGPSSVSLARIFAKPTLFNADIANTFQNDHAAKKITRM
jgi:hypothetical protein